MLVFLFETANIRKLFDISNKYFNFNTLQYFLSIFLLYKKYITREFYLHREGVSSTSRRSFIYISIVFHNYPQQQSAYETKKNDCTNLEQSFSIKLIECNYAPNSKRLNPKTFKSLSAFATKSFTEVLASVIDS